MPHYTLEVLISVEAENEHQATSGLDKLLREMTEDSEHMVSGHGIKRLDHGLTYKEGLPENGTRY